MEVAKITPKNISHEQSRRDKDFNLTVNASANKELSHLLKPGRPVLVFAFDVLLEPFIASNQVYESANAPRGK